MPERDFCRGGRLVRCGRRAYLCRRPTVEAVLGLLDSFGPEILALRALAAQDGLLPGAVMERGLAALASRPDDAAAVLSLCVEAPGLDAAGVAERLCRRPKDIPAVAAAVCAQADLKRIWSGLTFGEGADERGNESRTASALVLAGAVLHASPVELMTWPYEALQEALTAKVPVGEDAEEAPAVEAPGVVTLGPRGVN